MNPWEPSILRRVRVWSHVSHNSSGGKECGAMKFITIEGGKSVWGSYGVAFGDYKDMNGGGGDRALIAVFMREQ